MGKQLSLVTIKGLKNPVKYQCNLCCVTLKPLKYYQLFSEITFKMFQLLFKLSIFLIADQIQSWVHKA